MLACSNGAFIEQAEWETAECKKLLAECRRSLLEETNKCKNLQMQIDALKQHKCSPEMKSDETLQQNKSSKPLELAEQFSSFYDFKYDSSTTFLQQGEKLTECIQILYGIFCEARFNEEFGLFSVRDVLYLAHEEESPELTDEYIKRRVSHLVCKRYSASLKESSFAKVIKSEYYTTFGEISNMLVQDVNLCKLRKIFIYLAGQTICPTKTFIEAISCRLAQILQGNVYHYVVMAILGFTSKQCRELYESQMFQLKCQAIQRNFHTCNRNVRPGMAVCGIHRKRK